MTQPPTTPPTGPSGSEEDVPVKCADCWCVKTPDNWTVWNSSRYCDHCLLERLRAGEHVLPVPSTNPEEASDPMFYHLCDRCDGTGEVLLTAWQPDTTCFKCDGRGFVGVFAKSVQRWQRWSATFHSNRVDEVKGRKPRT